MPNIHPKDGVSDYFEAGGDVGQFKTDEVGAAKAENVPLQLVHVLQAEVGEAGAGSLK